MIIISLNSDKNKEKTYSWLVMLKIKSLVEELAHVVGADNVVWEKEDLIVYEYDGSIDRSLPLAVVLPGSAAEVSKCVKISQLKTQINKTVLV